ncbi:MAG: succinyldiaminopimelate transaminase [Micrococcaceae bacterium]
MTNFGLQLPDYPWETLAPYQKQAKEHPDGVINLSIGTPVDPTPKLIQEALANHTDAHGYPTTHGMQELREAISAWFARRRNVSNLDPQDIMPTIGSKEFIAWLPTLLGLKKNDVVIYPAEAYPTYDIGAQIAGCKGFAADSISDYPKNTKLIWLNSPGNPNGKVLTHEEIHEVVDWARKNDAIVASDECYAELGWNEWEDKIIPCLLDPEIAGESHKNLLCVYSLSKQSNLAGYRTSFVAGDSELIANLINTRKHAGMIVPTPIQYAIITALGDDKHVQRQKDIYRERRTILKDALENSGFKIKDSDAGLYLWATKGEDCWDTLGDFAKLGIIAGPGVFYGTGKSEYVRIAITEQTDKIKQAAKRLTTYYTE